jgi:hypothetical protein
MKRRREARCALSSLFNLEAMLQISRELASVRQPKAGAGASPERLSLLSVFQD